VKKAKRENCSLQVALRASIMIVGVILITPAQAQFVCGGSTDGSEGQNGGGANASGSTNNFACGPGATAIGTDSLAGFFTGNTAIGNGANASTNGGVTNGSFNTAIGFNANASGDGGFNTATGATANARGNSSLNTAAGFGADAHGDGSFNTATGTDAASGGNNSFNTAIGSRANANGDGSFNIATGSSSDADGNNSGNIANGFRARANGAGSSNIAIGSHADALGNGAENTAVGANSIATGNNSSAFGAGAQAPFINSAAFGAGAVATRPNQQVFGTSSNTYTLPGLTSQTSVAAQSGPTQLVTTDAAGNLAATAFSSTGLASASDLTALSARVDQKVNKALTGTAMAFAMSASPTLLPGKKFALSANWGTFQGQNGTALTGAVRLYKDVQLNAAFAYGFRENMAGGRAGVGFQW